MGNEVIGVRKEDEMMWGCQLLTAPHLSMVLLSFKVHFCASLIIKAAHQPHD
jgi:hypothetical protein